MSCSETFSGHERGETLLTPASSTDRDGAVTASAQVLEPITAPRCADYSTIDWNSLPSPDGEARPRILYLIGQLGVGGYERQLVYLLGALDQERYRPAVVIWGSADHSPYVQSIQSLNVPVYQLSSRLSAASKLLLLRRIVRRWSPRLVHSYSFYTNFSAWWSTCGTQTKAIGSIRNNFVSEIREAGRILGPLSARWPQVKICNSVAAKAAVDATRGFFKPSHVHVVTNGLDLTHFTMQSPQAQEPVLLAVGRLSAQKRWDLLLRAMAEVKHRGLRFRVRQAGQGPLKDTLQAQARELGVREMIDFLGIRPDMPALFAESSFLVHTAEEEGCPNVIMEAMACGRAVVATDAGHSPLLVEDGKTGFIVKCGDVRSLSARMADLIRFPGMAKQMGKLARVKAEREFGIDQLCRRTEHVYDEVTGAGFPAMH